MEDSPERPSYEPIASTVAQGEEPAARLSAVQRLWMVFTSPTEVFADIGIKPTWVLCLVVMIILGVVTQIVVVPHVDFEAGIRAQLGERAAEMGDDQIDELVAGQQKFAKFGPILALVIAPAAWAIMAAIFLVLLKIVGSEIDFIKTLSTALHAYWPPTLVESVLTCVLIQRMGKIPQGELPNIVKSHPGAFLSPDAPAWLGSLASTFSVFNIWTVVLLVIGFKVVGKLSTGRAVVVALVPWTVWIAGKVGLTALISAMG